MQVGIFLPVEAEQLWRLDIAGLVGPGDRDLDLAVAERAARAAKDLVDVVQPGRGAIGGIKRAHEGKGGLGAGGGGCDVARGVGGGAAGLGLGGEAFRIGGGLAILAQRLGEIGVELRHRGAVAGQVALVDPDGGGERVSGAGRDTAGEVSASGGGADGTQIGMRGTVQPGQQGRLVRQRIARVGVFSAGDLHIREGVEQGDAVSKVFGDLLPHSCVHSFGINKSVHFRASSADKRTEIGRMFAPTDPWDEFGKRIQSSEGAQVGGLMSLRMREIKNDDVTTGSLEARIEPSQALDQMSGIFVAVNRHFELHDYKEGYGAIEAIRKLDQEFVQALKDSDEIIESIASISA